ncbi:MAG: EthD domain-containing protein [Pseudomonadales bacterium]
MEKAIYLLWKVDDEPRATFAERMLEQLAPKLLAENIAALQINVVDETIRLGEHMLIENSKPRYYAMVSLWLESAIKRAPLEAIMSEACDRIAGYLVTESEPLPNTTQISPLGERTPGLAHVVLLQKPAHLSYEEWIEVWHGSHSQIAIDTQSTFVYRQNVVSRTLTADAPACDAIVEEAFPIAAMTSWEVFYDAEGDPERMAAHQQTMIDSCQRFIEFDKLNACSTSEYQFKRLLAAS